MAENLPKQLEVMGPMEIGDTYQEGYEFGKSMVARGYDGLWTKVYITNQDAGAVEREILDPANREKLRDIDSLSASANRAGAVANSQAAALDDQLMQMSANIGGRDWALGFANVDFTKYLNAPAADQEVLAPASATVQDLDDAVAYLATFGSAPVGMLHAVADEGCEARLMGTQVNALSTRLYDLLVRAQKRNWINMINLKEPAELCVKADDNIDRVGYKLVGLMTFREYEADLAKYAAESRANRVAYLGSQAEQYDANTDRFKSIVAKSGFTVAGAKAPDSSNIAAGLANIEADSLVNTDGGDATHRFRLGSVAFILNSNSTDFESQEWFDTYCPAIIEGTSEAAAKKAWNEFMHLQYDGYMQLKQAKLASERGRIRVDYTQRMRRLCAAAIPSVVALSNRVSA